MTDVPLPRPARRQSAARGVSVSASQRSKPKNAPFKYLRKDEGRLSYTCQPDSPMSGSNANNYQQHSVSNSSVRRERASVERRVSRSLREAIANDMRKGKNQDPFAAVVIAVPKRSPPPNPAAQGETQSPLDTSHAGETIPPQPQQQQLQHSPPPHQQYQHSSIKQHERAMIVDDVEPNGSLMTTSKPRPQPSRSPEDVDRSAERMEKRMNASQIYSTPRRGEDYDNMEWQSPLQRRYASEEMPRGGNGVVRRTAPRRYLDPMDQDDDYARGSRNFFPRQQRQEYRPTREEDNLVEQLEIELQAAREERGRYHQLKTQLEREKQRFEEYCNGVEQDIEEERAELDAARASEKWQVKKDVKVVEERYKSTLELLKTERESNKKLTEENELLRHQLEGMTTHMRETQKLHKAETSRLRREIESLTRRNEELLEMAREQQIAALENSSKQAASVPALQISPGAPGQSITSSSSTRRGSEDHEYPMVRPMTVGYAKQQQQSSIIPPGKKTNSLLSEERERKRLEAEEKERKRLETEDRERKRLEAEEKERKRLETEDRERKRLEAEEKERKRRETEERERKRLEAEEKEKERKRLETEERELRSQRRVSGLPINTPRGQNSKIKDTGAQQSTSKTSSTVSVSRKPRRAPTAEELIADDEPTPTEDFPNDAVVSQTALGENPNKREVLYRSGKREIHYANGTRKVILPSGHVILYFTNGDIKRTFPSGKSTYWYAAAQTTHTQHAGGVQVFQFHSSGQIERHLADGKKEILYPDGIYKIVFADGRDETVFPDEV